MFDSELIAKEPPGPQLAMLLANVELGSLSGQDRVVAVQGFQRMVSHYQARFYESIASVGAVFEAEFDDDPELAVRATSTEIRAALRLTRRAADVMVAFGTDVTERLPSVLSSLACGHIDLRRAKTITHGIAHIAQDTARSVADKVLVDADRLTTGQLAARLRRLCIEADPEDAKERFEDALDSRRLVAQAGDEGTGTLMGIDLPPDRVVGVARRITELARSLKTSEERRTLDQLRADVFLDLLEGKEPSEGRAGSGSGSVDLRVDLETLVGSSENPGEIAGFGPIIADIARQVADAQEQSEWRFTVHSRNGGVVANGVTRRRPTSTQRRHVETRNRTCIFPGCRMPAADCDLDHRVPWADGGSTDPANLVPVCRHDHTNRHRLGWKHRALPNHDHHWTSPLGLAYTTSGAPP